MISGILGVAGLVWWLLHGVHVTQGQLSALKGPNGTFPYPDYVIELSCLHGAPVDSYEVSMHGCYH